MTKRHYAWGALVAGALIAVLGWVLNRPDEQPVASPAPPRAIVESPVAPVAEAPKTVASDEPVTVEGHFIDGSSWAPVQTTATLSSDDGSRRQVTSAADGSFSTRLEPGAWRVVSADGEFVAATDKPQLFVPASGLLRGVRVRFERLEWLEGLVVDSDQVPLADARVDDAITDETGYFRVRAIREPGQLKVSHRCCKSGHSWSQKGSMWVLKLRRWKVPPLGQVRGLLVGTDGQSCRGVVGIVEPPAGIERIAFPTAKDGTFTLPVFGNGSRAYALSAENRVESEPLVVGQSLRLVIACGEMRDDALLTLRAVDAAGTPWTACSLGNDRSPDGLSDGEGRISVRLPRVMGAWRLRCLGTTTVTEVKADLTSGDMALGDVVLARGANTLSGLVSDRSTGKPVANATVSAMGPGITRVASSDVQGRFEFDAERLPPRLVFSAAGYVPLELKIETAEVIAQLTPMSATDGGVRQEYEGVGLGLASRVADGGTGLRITLVAQGGPAEEAGLRVNDELAAVDGVPVTDFARPRDLHERVKGPAGTWVKLSVWREGRAFDVRVERRRIER